MHRPPLPSKLRLTVFVDAGKGCRHPLCHHPCNVTKETSGAYKRTINAVDTMTTVINQSDFDGPLSCLRKIVYSIVQINTNKFRRIWAIVLPEKIADISSKVS